MTLSVRNWGPWIYRCDVKRDEQGKLWLIPEQSESKNVLVWAPRFCDHRTTKSIKYLPNEPLVTQIDFRQREHMLILLTPGNPISWYTHSQKAMPGTGPTWRHPLRRAKYELDVTLLRRLSINNAGEFFAFH